MKIAITFVVGLWLGVCAWKCVGYYRRNDDAAFALGWILSAVAVLIVAFVFLLAL